MAESGNLKLRNCSNVSHTKNIHMEINYKHSDENVTQKNQQLISAAAYYYIPLMAVFPGQPG